MGGAALKGTIHTHILIGRRGEGCVREKHSNITLTSLSHALTGEREKHTHNIRRLAHQSWIGEMGEIYLSHTTSNRVTDEVERGRERDTSR